MLLRTSPAVLGTRHSQDKHFPIWNAGRAKSVSMASHQLGQAAHGVPMRKHIRQLEVDHTPVNYMPGQGTSAS